jgi:hypothetical protein
MPAFVTLLLHRRHGREVVSGTPGTTSQTRSTRTRDWPQTRVFVINSRHKNVKVNVGRVTVLVAAALVSLVPMAFAQARKSAAAQAAILATTMQVDRHARLRLEASVRKEIEAGSASQQELDCVRAADMDFVVDAYARAILATLSAEEITRALAFYASEEGQAFLEHSIDQELRPSAVAATGLTPAEQRALTKFLSTNAGKKLLAGRVLETGELKTSLARGLVSLTRKCRGASP